MKSRIVSLEEMNNTLLGDLKAHDLPINGCSYSHLPACGSPAGIHGPLPDNRYGSAVIEDELTSQNYVGSNNVMLAAKYPSIEMSPHDDISNSPNTDGTAVLDFELGVGVDALRDPHEQNLAGTLNMASGNMDIPISGTSGPDLDLVSLGLNTYTAVRGNSGLMWSTMGDTGGAHSLHGDSGILTPESTRSSFAVAYSTTAEEQSPSLQRQWSSESSTYSSWGIPCSRGLEETTCTSSIASTLSLADSKQITQRIEQSLFHFNKSSTVTYSTPLHHAVARAHVLTVQELISYGADLSALDNEGRTALHICATSQLTNNLLIIQLLVEAGALLEITDRQNLTPLQIAAGRGNDQTVKLLLTLGADVNSRS
ncbi:MAG: hypothetical protein M1836_005778 [Candelina mexicana]|nr:MAG: hypothetical protein M1836_005778 [Candelina mexicana]